MEPGDNQTLDVKPYVLAMQLYGTGFCEYDLPPGSDVQISASWADILGYDVREIPHGQAFLSWWGQQLHPHDHQRVLASFNRLYSSAKDRLRCQFQIQHAKGHWLDVEVLACAIKRNAEHRAERIFSVMRELQADENPYRSMLENLHEGIWVLDKYHNIQYVNQYMADLLGYRVTDMLGKAYYSFINERLVESSRSILHLLKDGEEQSFLFELRHKDGSLVFVNMSATPMLDEEGQYNGVIAGVIDVGYMREQELRVKMLSSAVEQSSAMVVITDAQSRIEYVNHRFTEVTGYSKDNVLDKNIQAFFIDDESDDLQQAILHKNDWHGEVQIKTRQNQPVWVLASISSVKADNSDEMHYIAVLEDMTQLKEDQRKIEQLAYVDSLTGLANRLLLRDRLEQVLKMVQRNHNRAALLYLDLDQFKRINDSLGHDVGDALLMRVAENLRNCVRHQDTVARMGGDEFVILLTDVDDMAGASLVAGKILRTLEQPIKLLKHEIIVTCSIGITLAPDDSLDADILLKNADLAMYQAKSKGRNNYQFFTDDMNEKVVEQLMVENQLRKALKEGEILIYFQPQVDIQTGEIIGAESLIRWQHPQKGLLGPDSFIGVAEETGLVVQLGEQVFRMACEKWIELGFHNDSHLRLAVNLSARQFRDSQLLPMIQHTLEQTGFNPQQLEIEITETMLMENIELAITVLDQIKEMGIGISIDDFGTGYSSLNYLKRLPISALKIDKAFIDDIPNDKEDMEISAAVIAMAHKLNIQVVAEGIETQQQWQFLKDNHCDIGQGYLFGKPVAPEVMFEAYQIHRLNSTD